MTRCIEYYEKCEKDGCDWCDKDKETVRTIEEYIKFYKHLEELGVPKNTTIVGVPEGAIRPLIREKDAEIKAKVISSISKSLKSGKHPVTGKFSKNNLFSESEIKSILDQERQVKQFKEEHPAFNDISDKVTQTVMDLNNDQVKEKVIEAITEKNVILSDKELDAIITDADHRVLEAAAAQRKNAPPDEPTPPLTEQEDLANYDGDDQITNAEKISFLTEHILKPQHVLFFQEMVDAGEAEDLFEAMTTVLDRVCEMG